MAVTRSSAAERGRRPVPVRAAARPREFVLLAAAAVLVLLSVGLTWKGRTETLETRPGGTLNLSGVSREGQLAPYLAPLLRTQAERDYVARRIVTAVREHGGSVPNVGALGRIRVPASGVRGARGLPSLAERAAEAQPGGTIPLLTAGQVAALKPALVVREMGAYRWSLVLWTAVLLAGFAAVHLFWTVRGFRAPETVLPLLLLLSGAGFTLMVALRDPLRDTLAFADFAQGVLLGCIALAAASTVDYARITGRFAWVPLLASFVLSLALILFGTGPGASDAKVNLLGFQPAEVIRLLVVFFLAAYFAHRWELLRTLREKRPEVAKISRWVEVPRLEYLLPVVAGVAVSLLLFFFQKDLGPALIIACVFLAMYAVARDRYLFAAGGLALLLAGFLAGYWLKYPRTVAARVDMWLSPWDNAIRGGEQVVHALWGFATGGLFGTGAGLGDPEIMPAAHTDLILAALGEEWGFAGLLAVALAYALLLRFGWGTALRARSDYDFFLATGLTLTLALQILLIAGGVLGVLPLSGVVTPFLSYGRTGLIVNLATVGALMAIANRGDGESTTEPFRGSLRSVGWVLASVAAVIAGRAAYVQVVRADATLGAGALTVQADGQRRFQYNPRLLAIERTIRRGDILDRNGLPLASSDWNTIAKHREAYTRLGLPLPETANDSRRYPLGAYTVHLLGDLRTRANWGARNSSLAERDATVALQGYDDRATVVEVPDPRTGKPTYTVRYDYRELVPLLRHRWQPDHPDVRRVRERDRTLRMSIDARLQVRATQLLAAGLRRVNRTRGAVVVLDAATGDLLASVSLPLPGRMPPDLAADGAADELLDRARYGLYPPGSTFKIVTAMAALRKDPRNAQQVYECKRLPDGRVGNYVRGWGRPIRDDVRDTAPHGRIAMDQAMTVSCNAWFAQLAAYGTGAEALQETSELLGIAAATPNTAAELQKALPQAGYGQAEVVASPFQMARAAATIAAGGRMPFGRWVIDRNNTRVQAPRTVLAPELAARIGGYMRRVVTSGTGRAAAGAPVEIAGKTGTAEVTGKPSHAWFAGFAPAGGGRKLAFAVLVENGQYGGSAAAPIAAEVMAAAAGLGLTRSAE